MKAVGELAGDAEGDTVAGAQGGAHLDEAGFGVFGDFEGDAAVAGHGEMGGFAIDEDLGEVVAARAETAAVDFDFALGEGGGGRDVLNGWRQKDDCGFGGHSDSLPSVADYNQRFTSSITAPAYNPAATSSKTIPQPSGSFSS